MKELVNVKKAAETIEKLQDKALKVFESCSHEPKDCKCGEKIESIYNAIEAILATVYCDCDCDDDCECGCNE